MIIIVRRRLIVIVCFLIFSAVAVSLFTHEGTPVFSGKRTNTVIIDAGHGFPDGGAVGMNGTIESTLNIKIAKLAEKKLKKQGYNVIMTRRDDEGIHSCEGNIIAKKKSDMQNRLKIINAGNADIFVSIHMNKFTDSRYNGAQVLYSSNYEQSKTLAELIQKSLWNVEDNPSKRNELRAPDSIYLLKKANIPAALVECGFLSNFTEEQLLNTKEYRSAIADAIVKGITEYYKLPQDEA